MKEKYFPNKKEIVRQGAQANINKNDWEVLGDAFFMGWGRMFLRLFVCSLDLLLKLNIYQLLWLIICFGMIVFGMLPWIRYELQFFKEAQYLASHLRWFFVLLSLMNITLLFLHIRMKQLLALVLLLVLGVLYTVAILYPYPLHSELSPADYHFTFALWGYGFALLGGFLLFIPAIGSPPFISMVACKNYLLTQHEFK